MKQRRRNHCLGNVLPAVTLMIGTTALAAGGQDAGTASRQALEMAGRIVRASDCRGGICTVLGQSDLDLALALAQQGTFVVDLLYQDRDLGPPLRQVVQARSVDGAVTARAWEERRLPYTDNLLNVVVVDSYPGLRQAGLTPAEVVRVLAPLGTAYLGSSSADSAETGWAETGWADTGWIDQARSELVAQGMEVVLAEGLQGAWLRVRKPWPEELDAWTHFLHGADGNPVARDRVVGPPRHLQWTGGPRWLKSHETDSSISTMVTERGRLFYIIDRGPISLAGDHPLPDRWFLEARDAFNGVILWRVPIERWGWREWKKTWFTNRPGDFPLDIRKRLVAVGDKVYVTLGYRAAVSQLDARTGEVLRTYAGTAATGEILCVGGTLVLAVHEDDRIRVVAVDAEEGRQLWASPDTYRGSTTDYLQWPKRSAGSRRPALDPAANMATDGTVVALLDETQIVALDCRTGAEKWRARFPLAEADRKAGQIRAGDRLWVGTMIVRDGVVLHASPNALAAFSAGTGQLLWSQPKKYIGHLWYEWKDVFVIDKLVWTWSAELDQATIQLQPGKSQREFWPRSVSGYDLQTGQRKRQVPLGSIFRANHHHRCYRNKATVRYILASRRGTEFVDLEHGQHTVDNWVRGTCHVGMMPANGLQYVPPHPCQCYIQEKLNGMNALAASLAGDGVPIPAGERLLRGPAFGQIDATGSVSPAQQAADWPAFRHDSMRTGGVKTNVPSDAAPLWRTLLGGKVSAPTVAGGHVFVARHPAG